jgi:hypothetical protein
MLLAIYLQIALPVRLSRFANQHDCMLQSKKSHITLILMSLVFKHE